MLGLPPSLLIFGPQARPSLEDLSELRNCLISNKRLSKLLDAARNLHHFWTKLVQYDSELARVPTESLLRGFGDWLGHLNSFPCHPSELPVTLAFPLNFLLQMTQYACLLQFIDGDKAQWMMLEKLEREGVQGFCVGFLSAITVASSLDEEELVETATRALRLAVCIGAYVDKDATHAEPTCISVRKRHKQVGDSERIADLLRRFPKTYVSAVTDESSMTITTSRSQLQELNEALINAGFVVQSVPVDGRFHCSVHGPVVEKLVEFSKQVPDIQFPGPDQLQVAVRSAVDGEVINQGDLVRHILENTLLKPIEWYRTLKLAVASLPPGNRCIALAGISSHFPPSLTASSHIQLVSLRSLTEQNSQKVQELHVNGLRSQHTPPQTPPGHTNDGVVLGTEHGWNTHPDTRRKFPSQFPPHSVAIVGMAGRFPGANSVDKLWELLLAGRSTVDSAPERVGLTQLNDNASQVRWWGNFIDDHDAFDHKFFNKSAREAAACDPQQRKLFEVVYEALESSGYLASEASSDSIDYGCYVGAVMNNYATNISCHPPTAYATTGTGRSYLSGAVSHHFGWTGPAMTIDTACSSSLVAIHTACRAIAAGDCSRAVAGGTNIITCPYDYRDLNAAGFLSPTGQCKPFDVGADGYCRGEAVCVVVLKALSAAIEENDHILGVIVGSATNQNSKKGPIVVPNAESQANIMKKVMDMSSVLPEEVTYVEAHGTGTTVGDPIEVSSIREAFGCSSRTPTLHFSSIKGNIGHAEAASGAAGLVKVLLMMRHRQIPPQASFRSLNPNIPALEPDNMAIPQRILPWSLPDRIACVSNYGAAGSNSIIMIRGAPAPALDMTTSIADVISPSKWPLILSASTKDSLSLYGQELLEWVRHAKSETPTGAHVADILFHLAHRANHTLSNIVSTSISDISGLETVLSSVASGDGDVKTAPSPQPIVLVFGGQEGRFVGLSEAVYKSSQIFRHHLDSCQDLSLRLGLEGLYPAIFQQEPLADLVTLHVALFAVQYSCARAWMDCGLKVDAVIGHSFGQITAFCVSGVLSLPDALKLVAGRASLVEKHWGPERGSMIALQADRQQVGAILDSVGSQIDYAEIACFNGPRNHVVVGSSEAIRAMEEFVAGNEQLRGSIRCQRLNVTNGFHSRFTETLLPYLARLADGLQWRSPTIKLEICSEMPFDRTPDSRLVIEHTRRPVYFQNAVERLMRQYPQAIWLEAGRGPSATQLIRACPQRPEDHSFMAPQLTTLNAQDSLVDVTIRLWKEGHGVQYWPFHRSQRRQYKYLSLPPYQFQKTRHWLPYVRSVVGTGSPVGTQQKGLAHQEIVSFIKGDKSTEAFFRISPTSKRFQALVTGHKMCNHTLMPASAYIEVVSRAALTLQEDVQAKDWVPRVEDLVMKAPIGLIPGKGPPTITIQTRRLSDPWPSWSFSITVQEFVADGKRSGEARETTTGSVHLHRRNSSDMTQELRRFDTLIGPRRWEQLINNPEAEGMRGKHIYRAFGQVVDYSESFRGIKTIACLGKEAAGTVRILPDTKDPPDQRLTDTPMIDSFIQFGGFLVNYFNEAASPDNLYVCHHIQRAQLGPEFSPDSNEWFVFSNMTFIDQDNLSADVYVSDTRSSKTVFTALGMSFAKMTRASLARILSGPDHESRLPREERGEETGQTADSQSVIQPSVQASNNITSKRADILRIAASIADMSEGDLSGETSLADIGIDSLGATEMVGDIISTLRVTIDLATFLLFPNINAIIAHVDSQLGLQPGVEKDAAAVSLPKAVNLPAEPHNLANGSASGSCGVAEGVMKGPITKLGDAARSADRVLPTITSICASFDDVRLSYDRLGEAAYALNYWSELYPDDARLILAYTTEAFRELGCDLRALGPGEILPEVGGILPRHRQLVHRLHRFLDDEGFIETSDTGFIRTNKAINDASGEQIFHEIECMHPLNAPIRYLLQAVGPHLAACLKGDADALQFLFGNRSNKKWLDELYRDWPMLVTATQLLGNFLCQAFRESSSVSGPFRILEVGAGTGGTTRHVVDLLTRHGIPFEYHFTDISATLVHKAKASFASVSDMSFGVLDIEREPPAEFTEAFHIIISTNCIHATRNLASTLVNLRKMLREDGAVALIEMTAIRPVYVFDVIVGLLEGWWLFEDDRLHALAGVDCWEKAFKDAGFREVMWSDGESLEAKTVRVICGFRKQEVSRMTKEVSGPTEVSVQEVVFKTTGSQNIHADIYCPMKANPDKRMPIALMIHGGSHIIFSRKDIRPPQTRIILDMGLVPVSLDHRLCPETRLVDGPMADVCDAVEWARTVLPSIQLRNPDVRPDPNNVVIVGWSSGGQLALSTGWTAPARGLRPPNAILAFYCPTDYEDEWWQKPIQPIGAEDCGEEYDVLEAVQDEPPAHADSKHPNQITNYGIIGAWEPLSDPRIRSNPRSRIVLHMNWKAQTLPVVIGGLPSRRQAASRRPEVKDWNALPQPPAEEIRRCSPLAQVRSGNYGTPTFLVHGTADDLIPWQQSVRTIEEMKARNIDAQLILVPGGLHVCDTSHDPESAGWQAVLEAYRWLGKHAFLNTRDD
ncbi:Iterative polyketide synthase CazM 3 [Colletotrichum chlorophyti]|uniref:Iterative polyketide synthase CazM 3 n=1 Tax=Colletotrichum chlorophyti TaxID=708187 RepID=A0A1Q8S423_9PEZI|nr:Iterative polyketide synthase CazM 3 [Colletotrichum chlorophyti]